jgi:hypothetical protein
VCIDEETEKAVKVHKGCRAIERERERERTRERNILTRVLMCTVRSHFTKVYSLSKKKQNQIVKYGCILK